MPFSIKCRIGVDDFEGEEYLKNFISTISDYEISTFVIHARKAISGLDTKRNRSIPPLNYDLVFKIDRQTYNNLADVKRMAVGRYLREKFTSFKN